MSKFNNKHRGNKSHRYPIVAKITANVNKKGYIKARSGNKKETKILEDMCMHHIYNKKGKLKEKTYRNNSDGRMYCSLCGEYIKTTAYKKEEIKELRNKLKVMNNQMKFIAIGIDAGQETEKLLAQFAVQLRKVFKVYGKLTKIANKQNRVKRDKQNNNNKSSSTQYGSWGNP